MKRVLEWLKSKTWIYVYGALACICILFVNIAQGLGLNTYITWTIVSLAVLLITVVSAILTAKRQKKLAIKEKRTRAQNKKDEKSKKEDNDSIAEKMLEGLKNQLSKSFASPFYILLGGFAISLCFYLGPIIFLSKDYADVDSFSKALATLHHTIKLFVVDSDFSMIISNEIVIESSGLKTLFTIVGGFYFIAAPTFTLTTLLSFVKDLFSMIKIRLLFKRPVYIFSELNDMSIAIAKDIVKKDIKGKKLLIFTDVYNTEDEAKRELVVTAQRLGAICLSRDILELKTRWFKFNKIKKYYCIGTDQDENMKQALKIIDSYGYQYSKLSERKEDALVNSLICEIEGVSRGEYDKDRIGACQQELEILYRFKEKETLGQKKAYQRKEMATLTPTQRELKDKKRELSFKTIRILLNAQRVKSLDASEMARQNEAELNGIIAQREQDLKALENEHEETLKNLKLERMYELDSSRAQEITNKIEQEIISYESKKEKIANDAEQKGALAEQKHKIEAVLDELIFELERNNELKERIAPLDKKNQELDELLRKANNEPEPSKENTSFEPRELTEQEKAEQQKETELKERASRGKDALLEYVYSEDNLKAEELDEAKALLNKTRSENKALIKRYNKGKSAIRKKQRDLDVAKQRQAELENEKTDKGKQALLAKYKQQDVEYELEQVKNELEIVNSELKKQINELTSNAQGERAEQIKKILSSQASEEKLFERSERKTNGLACGKKELNDRPEIYVYAANAESETLLDNVSKELLHVRRINENRNLVFETMNSNSIFDDVDNATGSDINGDKQMNVAIIGLGGYGMELLKTLSWLGQAKGYYLNAFVFDGENGTEKLKAVAPDMIKYNYLDIYKEGNEKKNEVGEGDFITGLEDTEASERTRADIPKDPVETSYSITFYNNVDVKTTKFLEMIEKIDARRPLTSIYVTLGNDSLNVQTAMNIRRTLARITSNQKAPKIYAVVFNTIKTDVLQKGAGNDYNITYIGNIEKAFSQQTIEQQEIERTGFIYHSRWSDVSNPYEARQEQGKYEKTEYFRRSSMAQALFYKLTYDKVWYDNIEELSKYEHNRWSAFMRADGFVACDDSSKKDTAVKKTHHNLVPFNELSDSDKDKDFAFYTADKRARVKDNKTGR